MTEEKRPAGALETEPYAHFAHEGDYPELDKDAACRRLARALAQRTVYTTPEGTDFAPFERLQGLMREGYPRLMAAASLELVGHSVLITLEGTRPDLPGILLLAHQDVVPVAEGTEGLWEHPPFSGHLDDEWVWGRGALDIKEMLMGELEACELLLARHGRPARTIWLCFGEDEEVTSRGACALAAELGRRGAHAAFSLDEGVSTFSDGAAWGAPGEVLGDVCLSQKGYLDLRLTAAGAGGHSSNPFGVTLLERFCRAVSSVAGALPHPLPTPLVSHAFSLLADKVTQEPLRSLARGGGRRAEALARAAARVPSLYPLVTTTMAVDMLDGGSSAANVMPGDVSATVNFRLLPPDTAEDVMSWVVPALEGTHVTAEVVHETPAGRMDEPRGMGYDALLGVLGRYHPGVTFLPSIVCGGTDSVRYEAVCDSLLRFTPFRPAPSELSRGVHGTNERISRRAYAQGIRVICALLEATALS